MGSQHQQKIINENSRKPRGRCFSRATDRSAEESEQNGDIATSMGLSHEDFMKKMSKKQKAFNTSSKSESAKPAKVTKQLAAAEKQNVKLKKALKKKKLKKSKKTSDDDGIRRGDDSSWSDSDDTTTDSNFCCRKSDLHEVRPISNLCIKAEEASDDTGHSSYDEAKPGHRLGF